MLGTSFIFSPTVILWIGVFAGAFVAGFAGFGLAAATGGFHLHVIDPETAVPLMILCSVLVQSTGLICLRKSIDMRPALPFAMGGVAGLPVAMVLFQMIDSQTFRSIFRAFLVLYAGWGLTWFAAKPLPKISDKPCRNTVIATPQAEALDYTCPVFGFLAGIVGGMTAMPGAIVSVWADAKGVSKAQQRGFVQSFILGVQIVALALMLATADALFRADIVLFLSCLGAPHTRRGAWLVLYGRCGAAAFRTLVLVIVLCSGSGLRFR